MTYKTYTQEWKSLVASKDVHRITKHLNSGFSFYISREEYEQMKANNPEYVHYYFGIKNGTFTILVIDNVADKQADHSNILEKELSNQLNERFISAVDQSLTPDAAKKDNVISLQEALERSFRWKLFAYNWIEAMANGKYSECIFPMIINPFEDLDNVFKKEEHTHAYHFMGLKKTKKALLRATKEDQDQYAVGNMEDYMIDIIITNITQYDNTDDMNDNSCPGGTMLIVTNKSDFSLLPD